MSVLSRNPVVCKLQSELENALPGSGIVCFGGIGRKDPDLIGVADEVLFLSGAWADTASVLSEKNLA